MNYDRIYWWNRNGWNEAVFDCYPDHKSMDQTITDLERMGYPAVPGRMEDGPPMLGPSDTCCWSCGVRQLQTTI